MSGRISKLVYFSPCRWYEEVGMEEGAYQETLFSTLRFAQESFGGRGCTMRNWSLPRVERGSFDEWFSFHDW